MISELVVIKNKNGLHARPASQLVRLASQFSAEIKIMKDGLEVNGKSIMGVMMLAAETGSELLFEIEGDDEKEAFQSILQLIENKFNEE
jgi:phosphocarrier protein